MASSAAPLPLAAQPQLAALDDEEDILELLRSALVPAGYRLTAFSNPSDFLAYLQRELPALLLLDLMLPGIDGLEICKRLRKDPRTERLPVLMLTARVDELDKVLAFELGVDDYVTKPFSPRELVSRVKALLRRSESRPAPRAETLALGGWLLLDRSRVKCVVSGVEIPLTTTEFRLLTALAEQREMVLSRQQLLELLHHSEKFVTERTIDVHIRHLRAKLGEAGRHIQNIRGMGYKLEP